MEKGSKPIIEGEIVGGRPCVFCKRSTIGEMRIEGPMGARVKIAACNKCVAKVQKGAQVVGVLSEILRKALL